jgi:hypothetical protein
MGSIPFGAVIPAASGLMTPVILKKARGRRRVRGFRRA